MTRDITTLARGPIPDPPLHVVLYQPEIPANTGNIARLCGAAQVPLHLIHPLGFKVDDKHLKRAGLDYWHEVDIRQHKRYENFVRYMAADTDAKITAFSRYAGQVYTMAKVHRGDYLLFGRETTGLPDEIREEIPCYRIPIRGRIRSLNLSTTVGIVVYHYLHKMALF